MFRSFRTLWTGVLLAVLGMSLASTVHAGESGDELCPPDGFEKDGICGHALAAMRRLEREPVEMGSLILEAQTDTDITHVLLDIELKPDVEQVAGTVTHTVTSLVDGLSQFTLDLRNNMAVDAVQVNGSPAGYSRPTHQILISLDDVYDTGESFAVAVTYHGLPDDGGFGSFGFDYHGFPGTPIISSLSEPYYASTWWPCKEAHVNIDDKFTLDMHITVPDNLTAVTNGLLQGTDTLSGGRKRYRWHEGYPINVYLVSVAATNYSVVNYTYNYPGGSMPVVAYAYPESLNTVQNSTANLVQMIATLSDPAAFGQYPFINEKYGIAQFPWGGGMEHQTITSQGAFSETLNVHELAHQWWGDAVTCKTWHDIWLNEGFATWSEALWQERKPGGSIAGYKTQMENRRPSSASLGGTVYCYNISSVSSIFSSNLSYKKGGWVVHMLRHVLGDQVFFDTLATYRATYEDSSATTDDFKNVAEGVSGRDLDWFFNEWVYNGGAPSYRYGWQQQQIGGQNWVRLRVQQYQTSYPLFAMPIDIMLTTASGSQTHTIWHEAQAEWYLLPAPASVTSVAFDPNTWILRNDGSNVSYVNGPPKLIGTTPQPGAVVAANAAPGEITLRFSEAVTWSAGDFTVTGSGSGPVSFTAGYNPSDYSVKLTLTSPLPAGQMWTVQVADTLKSQAANAALDGEVSDPAASSSLPSGDGLPGGAAVVSFSVSVPADFDGDGDVDGSDLNGHMLPCLSGSLVPILPTCQGTDLDGDGDVDLGDFGRFQRCLSGPGILPALNCAG